MRNHHYHLLQDLSLVGSYVLKQHAFFFFVSQDDFLPADNKKAACAVLVMASSVAANSSSFLVFVFLQLPPSRLLPYFITTEKSCIERLTRLSPVSAHSNKQQGQLISINSSGYNNNSKLVALDRERTVPAERPPLVGEDNANFCE
jgi:hypothetical protein